VGESSTLTAGLDYARRHYIAERGSLQGFVLDAPDVNYTAITPGVAMQVPITPTITMLGGIDAMLLLDAGAIQSNASYGPAGAYGLEAFAGANLAIAKQIGVRVALEYSQIHLSFRGGGTMSNNRDNDPSTQDVNAATDRALGVVATVALAY
jgi:hypothetical protein